MDQSIVNKFFLTVVLTSSLLLSEPQFGFGLGQTTLSGEEFRFKGNNGSIEFTANAFSRLQFGLKYDGTSALVNKTTKYGCAGWLGTIKFVLNTLSAKSPYFGFNFGWLNSSLSNETIIYSARGSFTGEALAGYTFRMDEYHRINLEYRQRYIELKLQDKELLRSDTLAVVYNLIINNEPEPDRSMNKEEGLTTKKEYLSKKIAFNNSEIQKYETLITKYNQKILEEGASTQLNQERDFLIKQKQELEENNKTMLEILEK